MDTITTVVLLSGGEPWSLASTVNDTCGKCSLSRDIAVVIRPDTEFI